MSDRLTFPSLGDDQHAYSIHESGHELNDQLYRTGGLAPWAGMFATYGDRTVQHSSEFPAPVDRFEDYLASLATYLMDEGSYRRDEALDWLASHWPRPLDAKRIRFLASLKYDCDKPRWYALRENKVSAAESRKHDKRWVEIPSYVNGGVEGVYALCSHHDGWERGLIVSWAYYTQIRDVMTHDCDGWGPIPAKYFKIGDYWTADQAFSAVERLVESRIASHNAARSLDAWKGNTENRKRREAEKATAETEEVAR
jgi:hypothetical protein